MSLLQILIEQQKPTTVIQARDQGWKRSKDSAKVNGGCGDSDLDQVVINGNSYFKCKPNTTPEEPVDDEVTVDDEVKDDEVKDAEVKVDKKVEISQRMAEMFDVFRVFDREGTNLIKKLKEQDREIIKSRATKRITDELGDDIDDMTIVDDTFVQYLINYMVIDKNMDPFVIDYIPTSVYKLSYELVEAIGLAKVLSEQGFTTNSEKVYIQYTDGDNFKLIGGPGAKNQAAYEYNRKTGQPVSGPEEPAKSPEPQKSEEPEKRPEEGIQNKQLMNDIYKKANGTIKAEPDEVKKLIEDYFSPRQIGIIKSMNGEGYALLRPINPDMYEVADVKAKYGDDFESFTEFKMYRPKTSGVSVEERASSLSELSKIQNITKPQCKELIEQYYEIGKTGDVDISDEERKNAARQIYRCRRQHKFGGMFDFAKINDKLDEMGSTRWAQDNESGRFMINWNNKTVGTGDDVIELK